MNHGVDLPTHVSLTANGWREATKITSIYRGQEVRYLNSGPHFGNVYYATHSTRGRIKPNALSTRNQKLRGAGGSCTLAELKLDSVQK